LTTRRNLNRCHGRLWPPDRWLFPQHAMYFSSSPSPVGFLSQARHLSHLIFFSEDSFFPPLATNFGLAFVKTNQLSSLPKLGKSITIGTGARSFYRANFSPPGMVLFFLSCTRAFPPVAPGDAVDLRFFLKIPPSFFPPQR